MSGGTAGTPDKLKAGDYIQYDCDSSKEYMVVQSSAKQSDGTYGAKTTDAPVNMGDYRATISAGGVSIYYDYTITPQRIAQPPSL